MTAGLANKPLERPGASTSRPGEGADPLDDCAWKEMMVTQQVTLPEVQVMYVESATGLAGAAEAFDRLEARFPSLKGRRFYGTFQPPAGPYRACTAIEPGDDAPSLGLKTWVSDADTESERFFPSTGVG